MAGISYTSGSQPQADKNFNGGLNSTSGPLNVKDNESSDLKNIDLNKFGSILKRNGYACLSTAALGSSRIDGLHWYEFVSGTTSGRLAVTITNGQIYKMDNLDGVWDSITTAGITITANNHYDFENFTNKLFATNGYDSPYVYSAYDSAGAMSLPAVVTKAKYVKQFNNYLFLANVANSGTDMSSRIYWSGIKDPATWDGDQFIDISKDDGQQITGLKPLGDRLIVYKERSIYSVYFTGDADFPFILPGGGKTNSSVGCIAPWSIQEVENGHVFLSYDGLYYFDGNNSYKISDKIASTLGVDNSNPSFTYADKTYFAKAVSCVQKSKNRYFLSLTKYGSTTNDLVLVWDYFNNAFTIYDGLKANAMSTFYFNGNDERPHFGDYIGYVYRFDYGSDDYPANAQTAIDSYYYTNWKNYEDLCDQKGIPNIYLYYRNDSSTLTFAYSYDFVEGDSYAQTFRLSPDTSPIWGSVVWGSFNWGQSGGGLVQRRDLTGRGRVVRFKFSNNVKTETFRIDGLGTYVHLETNV